MMRFDLARSSCMQLGPVNSTGGPSSPPCLIFRTLTRGEELGGGVRP